MQNASKEIIIDNDFKAIIPPLSKEEYENLEKDIVANGCIVPLIVWPQPNGSFILIDGHNRYEICRKHNIGFKANARNFSSKSEALLQIINLQLGRRNLTPYARTELASKYEEIISGQARKAQSDAAKATIRKIQESKQQDQEDKKLPEADEKEPMESVEQETPDVKPGPAPKASDPNARKTAAKIGEIAGVSRDTVNKVKKINETASDDMKAKLRKGDLTVNQGYKIATLPEEERVVAEEKLASGEKPQDIIKNIPSLSNKEDELYSPKEYTDAAVTVMGSIDLDPASSKEADKSIDASRFFTKEDDGLKKSWNGNIWLNPPRSGEKQQKFISKLIFELEDDQNVKQACILVDAKTESDWFQELLRVSSAVMFARDYLKFRTTDGSTIRQMGQAVCYIGENIDSFISEFGKWGKCVCIRRD